MNKNVIKVLCFILICTISLNAVGFLFCFNSKNDFDLLRGFKSVPENSKDLINIGSSVVFNSFNPVQAEKEFGFSSCNYGIMSSPASVYKYEIIEALKTQKPKLIAIELYGALYDEGGQTDEEKIRRFVDNLPNSVNKFNAITELQSDNIKDYLFYSLPKYHTNYKDPFSAYFYLKRGISFLTDKSNTHTGFDTDDAVDSNNDYIELKDDMKTAPLAKDGEYYLRDLLDFCKKEKLEVVFYFTPKRFTSEKLETYERFLSSKKIVEEYGYEVFDYSLNWIDYGFEPTDFRDGYHLNTFGAEKFTAVFGKVIADRIK